MAKVVIDTNVIMSLLKGEPGAEKMAGIIKECADSGVEMLMSSVNFGELYYLTLRSSSEEKAEALYPLLTAMPIRIIEPDIIMVKNAGKLKAFKKMSLADCYAAALAKVEKASLITADREFKEVEEEIHIIWVN